MKENTGIKRKSNENNQHHHKTHFEQEGIH